MIFNEIESGNELYKRKADRGLSWDKKGASWRERGQ